MNFRNNIDNREMKVCIVLSGKNGRGKPFKSVPFFCFTFYCNFTAMIIFGDPLNFEGGKV